MLVACMFVCHFFAYVSPVCVVCGCCANVSYLCMSRLCVVHVCVSYMCVLSVIVVSVYVVVVCNVCA